ncbi:MULTISPECIES: ArnT family glycosyltransferase [Mycolicibacterium]|uniref:PMT family glycosyltransferase, 4-amino-4-deoxy-L-arabinose transferase n=1 Tax=Mycolicibacterium senegalense TaxID=1796 RepID=A0A378T2D4_9MYCO|nr:MULTISPECIES: glycosyltransferase family 39 protein [Mycolicibacterium]MCV7338597.1 glycosyltransferase family 39 protein [Mycolicibacterium senegalense]MDR7289701.1 4-amino-4-deoxy-L-arabinose transferase-like glycosyltransferase [Mycolicibacterium senegalense]OMB83779.1 mannosyltransferase [Mycolicibacterium conceptionense]QZA26514.1 glycosyltransferase family 39 protein [Mycolicibacterium senegalense]CDP82907.1 PMT family glycosyltransferase, 4-amino-4-deoxy-L-arabinose transferase [Myco
MTTTLEDASAEPALEVPPSSPWIARERLALPALLVATALAYLWNITVNGMGNQFYAASVWAGSLNWKALLFGSLDPANFITVDKPPVSQWVMGLSGQLFGFSSAGMLIPEALMGVGSVALLYGAVRRISGPRAALLAGAVLALTPVAALMFRFNNPDAVMVLLMTAAAYCSVRALEHNGARWMALAGVALGFAFLAKMLEGLMVMPAIGLVYLIAAPAAMRVRLLHLLGSLTAFLAASGWFVLLTLAWPASSRPYLAGSTDNNFMNLVLGYNGFGRVLGHNHYGINPDAHPAAGPHHGGWGDQTQGLPRLFTGEFGFEIGWLLPAALVAVVLVLISRRGRPRTDLVRAGTILFGSWLLIDGLVLSFMKSMVHPYYCLSLAPAMAAMFAIGVAEMWHRRDDRLGQIGLATLLLGAAVWGFWILGRNASWLPALRWAILVSAVGCVAVLLAALRGGHRAVAIVALAAALAGGLAGTTAYTVATLGQPHTGGGPSVGPADPDDNHGHGWTSDNPELNAMLRGTTTTWSAAINRSGAASGLELATHTAVMAIGGFTGTDPVPTLEQFQNYVADRQITYYILPESKNDHGGFFGNNSHTDISDWVKANFTSTKIGSDTVYDLRAPLRK